MNRMFRSICLDGVIGNDKEWEWEGRKVMK